MKPIPITMRQIDYVIAAAEGGSTATRPAAADGDAPGGQADAAGEPPARADVPAQADATAPAPTGQSLNVASALLDELQRLAGEGMVSDRQRA